MRRLAALALILALLAAACGGGDDSSARGGGPGGGDSGGDAWLTDLLTQVPDTGSISAQIIANDYVLAREGSGIELPASDDNADVGRYRIAMSTDLPGPQTSPAESTGWMPGDSDLQISRNEVGFTFEDIERDLLAGSPPDQIEVLQGSIDPDDVRDAVNSDPLWSDELGTAEAGGTDYFTWLDDGEIRPDLNSPYRQIGQSLRLAVFDGTAVTTRSTPLMESALTGDGPTLADNEAVTSIATVLQEAGAHSAFITTTPPSAAASRLEGLPSEAPDEVADELLGPDGGFDPAPAIGTGTGYRGDDQIVVEVIPYGDDATAQANADRLETLVQEGTSLTTRVPWSEVLTIDAIEVSDGRVIATFITDRPQIWLEAVLTADNIVSVGDGSTSAAP